MKKFDKRYMILFGQVVFPPFAIWGLIEYFTIPLMILSFFMFFLMRTIGSVIMFHRVFGHNIGKVNPIVEFVATALGYYGSLASPIAFCAGHALHHRYSDTIDDPHSPKYLGWRAMFPVFWKGSGPTGGDKRIAVRLRKNFSARFFHENYWILLPLPLLLLTISVKIFMFAYLIPATMTMWSLALSVFNHDDSGPDKKSVLYGILTGGEHHHQWHHDHPNDTSGEGWIHYIIKALTYAHTR